MSEYGEHPTQYGKLTDDQLYSLYRESFYSKLNEDEKLDLIQETVNRDASEKGEIGSPLVQFAHLPVNESGKAADGMIYINYDMAVRGVQTLEYNGQTMEHTINDFNVQTLNTALHENFHCLQDQIIDGTIQMDDDQKTNEYQANTFTETAVLQNGRFQLGSQYLTGETPNGYYMYFFQSTERDAYLSAEEKTNTILNEISSKYGTEKSFDVYEKSIEVNGYQAKEQEAIQVFQNSEFVKDLNQTLQNQYYGTDVPVNANTEAAVKAEMIATYNNMQQSMETNTEEVDAKMETEAAQKTMEEGEIVTEAEATSEEESVDNNELDSGEDCEDGLDI
jgi:hypothetical protein